MVIWKNSKSVKYGVAIFKFDGFGQYMLPLSFGEAVLIYEETDDSEWYRGCSISNRNLKGIFPASYVYIKWNIDSQIKDDVDVATSKELSAVLEITSVLREWGEIWKQLFVKKAEETDKVRKLLQDLLSRRRQVLSGALTADQLKQVKNEIANKIDYGNKLLGLDLVVRDAEGNVIDVDRTGVIDLYKMHLESAQRMEGPASSRKKKAQKNLLQYNGHNLYISIKNVVCKIGDDAEVFLTLYDGRENAFISEHYVVSWTKQGMPKDLDKLHNMSCLFTDLGMQDLQRDKLYIVCQIIRYGKMDMKEQGNKKYTQNLRRPFGVAVLHISDIVQGNIIDDEDKEYFLQLQPITGHDDTDSMVRRAIAKGVTQQQGNGQGIWLTLQKLHGDLLQVKEEHPLLINQFTAIARKQGFPDVIMPGDIRNDMYLTLISGIFDKGRKSSLNMQVIVGVYNSEGQLLTEVISLGAGEKLVSEYISTIYYHSEQPRWGEVVKLSIPTEFLTHGTHIRFSFKHRATLEEKDRSQKVFSMSYINLLGKDGTCLQDKSYDLAVFKCEAKKLDNSVAYFKLPSLKADALAQNKKNVHSGGLTFSKTDVFKIQFQLCSTKLAQNVDLLGLLKWRTQKEKLMTILPALMNVSGQEIVKFLQDTFDALFGILMEDASMYGEMVSNAVVFCIGLLADKKYHRFRSILDAYIGNLFSSTKAYITLVEILQKNIEGVQEADLKTDRREYIMKYYKALEYLVKFIVRSRSLSERAAPGKGRLEFEASINNLFRAIMSTMNMSGDPVLPLQGCALKYVPAVFGDLLEVFNADLLGHFARDLVERIAPNRLQTQKLTCIHQLVKSPLFFNPDSRHVMRPMIIGQLRLNMSNFEEFKVCADILNEMLSNFVKAESMGDISADISYLVNNLLRCIISTVIKMNLTSVLFGNYVAFIIGILDLMEDEHYTEYMDSFDDDSELLDCLMEFLLLFREFVKGNVYPPDWLSMTMVQNNVILRALENFSRVLYDRFLVGDSFQYQLWNTYFQLAVTFITQECLQLETFSETKRQKILERYGDMRMAIANRVVDMWQWLGINKIRLIQSMVKPFLEMTLVPETELRRITIPIFYDMIECEFRTRQHFKQVESELIMHLDSLIESGMKGDEEYKELFSQILTEKFHQDRLNNSRLCEVGLIFVETMSKLLSRLLDYRSVIQSEDNINNRMSCTVNILNFYQDIRREDMKERYLYKLCDLHLNVGSYTEAAFTLLQHADLIKWSDDPPINSNITSNRYEAKTQRELKERLYKDIIDYFDQGKMWEYGISRCKELAHQYESETYDYIQLSQILEKQAKFFENIITTAVRPEPTYFRVGYYGRGFPTFLRNKMFIYRGDQFEQLNGFKMRLQVQFPGAQFLNYLEAPGPDVTDSLKQWIQMCKVDPKPVERRKFRGKNVADQITKFYEVNDVSEFTLSRPFHKGKKDKDNEFASLWIERTSMNTEDSFPGKLRWFEVTNQSAVELSPVETAIDTLAAKNKEITSMANRYKSNPKSDLNPFTMLLNGVIDAAVMGGITNYEKIFFCKEYLEKHSDHKMYIEKIKELIVEQVDACEMGLKIHKGLVTPQLQPLHEKMEKLMKENKQKAAPYRKKQSDLHRRNIFPDGGMSHAVSPQRRVNDRPQTSFPSMDSPQHPGKRVTHIPQQSSPIANLGDKGNRHTTIVGPSSPVHKMIPSGGGGLTESPPPLPGRDRRQVTRSTSGSTNLPAPLPRKGINSGYDTIPTLPPKGDSPLEVPKRVPVKPAPYKPSTGGDSPKPPPKPDRKPAMPFPTDSPVLAPASPYSSSNENVFTGDDDNNDNNDSNDVGDDDDEAPPLIPQKMKTLRSIPAEPPADDTDDEDSEEPPPPPPPKKR